MNDPAPDLDRDILARWADGVREVLAVPCGTSLSDRVGWFRLYLDFIDPEKLAAVVAALDVVLGQAPAAPPAADVVMPPPVPEGLDRQWIVCKTCGRVYYYDYLPFSFSRPLTTAPCNHDVGSTHIAQWAERVTADEALKLLTEGRRPADSLAGPPPSPHTS